MAAKIRDQRRQGRIKIVTDALSEDNHMSADEFLTFAGTT
jgi:hypothetical protein